MPSKDPLYTSRIVLAPNGVIETTDGTDIVTVNAAGTGATLTGTETVIASEIALTDGSILVGNGSNIAAAVVPSGAVTMTNAGVFSLTSSPTNITLTSAHLLVGNGSNVAADVAVSGDATLSNAGVVTVVGATGTFNHATNDTWTKEVNHTSTVSATTTAATAGGNLSFAAGTSGTSGTGGAFQGAGGSGGTTGVGGTATLVGGAGGSASGTGGAANVTGGAGTAGNANGGDVVLTPGAKNGSGLDGGLFLRNGNSAVPFFKASAPAAKTTNATLTAAEILGGLITVNQGAAGTSTLTLPLGTSLGAALPSTFTTGDCFQFSVINISTNAAEDAIMQGNTGTTYVGATTINANDIATETSAATFVVRCTGANTFVCYRVS